MTSDIATLQSLFAEPIRELVYIDPGYSGHANDVWRVRTAGENAIVRAFRGVEPDNSFWDGCRYLFGIDPSRVHDLGPLNALLGSLGAIAVPGLLRSGVLGDRPCAVMECMPGTRLEGFGGLSIGSLEDFGRSLARIHAHTFPHYGNPIRDIRNSLATFPHHLAKTMDRLVDAYYRDDYKISAAIEVMRIVAMQLSPPDAATLVMVDIDPSQFLTDGERVTAMVDTDAYVVGPRELDLIGLEYVCDARSAVAIARGYSSLLPIPDMAAIRPVYRYLYRLLEVQGKVDLDEWMSHPAVFDVAVG